MKISSSLFFRNIFLLIGLGFVLFLIFYQSLRESMIDLLQKELIDEFFEFHRLSSHPDQQKLLLDIETGGENFIEFWILIAKNDTLDHSSRFIDRDRTLKQILLEKLLRQKLPEGEYFQGSFLHEGKTCYFLIGTLFETRRILLCKSDYEISNILSKTISRLGLYSLICLFAAMIFSYLISSRFQKHLFEVIKAAREVSRLDLYQCEDKICSFRVSGVSELSLVFDRFYRAESSRSDDGNGLGLCICDVIVRKFFHGEIFARLIDGRFWLQIRLPLKTLT